MAAPLSVALAQLVALEMQQVEQLADTRAAIAAIEKLSRPGAAVSPVTSMPRNPDPPAPTARPTSKRSAALAPAPPLVRGHSGAAAATARATSILRLIAGGTRATADLRAAVPVPEGATAHQHRQSIANALTRLKADGCLTHGDDGWALTAKGRTRAAKEEP